MKAYLVALSVVVASVAFADDIKLANGTVKKNVEIRRAEPDGLVVMGDDGIEKIPFSDLPAEVQAKYDYDPKKAAQFTASTQRAQAQIAAANAPVVVAAVPAAIEFHRPNKGSTGELGKDILRVNGRILRVVADGVILTDWLNRTVEPFRDARGVLHDGGTQYDTSLFVAGVTGKVDGDTFSGLVYPCGEMRYETTVGAVRTVHRYAATPELATKIISGKR